METPKSPWGSTDNLGLKAAEEESIDIRKVCLEIYSSTCMMNQNYGCNREVLRKNLKIFLDQVVYKKTKVHQKKEASLTTIDLLIKTLDKNSIGLLRRG